MAGGSDRLFEVAPREQVGARTGKLYEYQYHQAAAGALKLLDQSENAVCVYCEWHDDFVTESEARGLYTFYQVKTNKSGTWPIGEFFGLGKLNSKTKQRPLSASKSSIFSNLWDHTQKFGGLCKAFVFLSDAKLDPCLQSLLDECAVTDSPEDLSVESRELFDSILPSLARREKNLTTDSLYSFLKKCKTEIGIGTVDTLDDAKVIIVDRIVKASEVKLEWSEGRKIGANLVTIVRSKSHLVLTSLPSTSEELRALKALSISDVLKLLSLSEEGFRLLSEGAGEAVRTLSRLHRFCQARKIGAELIPQFCQLKTLWSSWWLRHADLVAKLDFVTFKATCIEILKAHNVSMSLREVAEQSKSLATKYNGIFNPLEPLSPEHVMGYIISLAVEAER